MAARRAAVARHVLGLTFQREALVFAQARLIQTGATRSDVDDHRHGEAFVAAAAAAAAAVSSSSSSSHIDTHPRWRHGISYVQEEIALGHVG